MKLNLKSVRESFGHTPRVLQLVWRSSRLATFCLGTLTLCGALLPLGVAYAGKRIIDSVVMRSGPLALRWVLLELALVAAQALIQRGAQLSESLLGARLSIDIHLMILDKALHLSLRHFEDPEFYDRLTRARREASSRPVSVVGKSFRLIQNFLTLLGYAALLLRFSPWAVLGLLLAAIPATLVEMRFSSAAFRMRNWRSPDARRLNYLEYVLANDNHAKEVKLFGIGPLLLSRFKDLSESFYQEDAGLTMRRITWGYLLSLLGTGAFYACYGLMALSAAAGRITLGNMSLYIVAFRQGQQAFQSILAAISGMYEDNLYLSNLFAYLEIPTDDETNLLPVREAALAETEEGIRLENVGFHYPGQNKWVVRGVDLFIPRGQSLALVGQNGAGKTTLIKLITRLYEPSEGRILLDGRELSQWPEAELHRRFSVVLQDFNQYQLSARENVGLGAVEALADQPHIERAIEKAGAQEVVSGLSEGLETQLGSWFNKGVELSGGQWQKIALARAFMRESADMLILDEPTAALDAEAEHAVFERFRVLTKGRTALLISHRFPTVRMADRILVLEAGKIVEDGTHAELLERGERYAKLFSLQAQGYL